MIFRYFQVVSHGFAMFCMSFSRSGPLRAKVILYSKGCKVLRGLTARLDLLIIGASAPKPCF